MIVIFLGLPGSGKGTQASILSKKINFPLLSIGDLLRDMSNNTSVLGNAISDYISQGKLVPISLINQMIEKFIDQNITSQGIILDGYPRNVEQANFLNDIITDSDIILIYLNINEKFIYKRLLGRFKCHDCGNIYNKYYNNVTMCVHCNGTKFIYRNDDEISVIKNRIFEYKNQTLPLLDFYVDKAKIFTLDAKKPKNIISYEIYETFCQLLIQ